MQREPNTEYILSLSYGKDSIACLEAIRQLGYPLDRIVHAEVWATDTIPADLPPMVEFKKKADKIILERYGIQVEHICAMRGGRKSNLTKDSSTNHLNEEDSSELSKDSRSPKAHGAKNSNCGQCQNPYEKLTYEKLFYHIPKRRKKSVSTGGAIQHRVSQRIPRTESAVVQFGTQTPSNPTVKFSDSQSSTESGATATSREAVYGFPISIGRGNWCTQLKQRVF